jgi:hypothetical protein
MFMYMFGYRCYVNVHPHVQGGAITYGVTCFFSIYRPFCLYEAHVRPEKYWLVCAGLLANHLFNLNSSFLAMAEWWVVVE